MKTKKYTFSPQNGKPGYCVCAQVFDEDGNHLATIKSTKVAKDASETAKLFSKSPEVLEALKLCFGDLKSKIPQSPARDNRINQIESLLKELE